MIWQAYSPVFFVIGGMIMAPSRRFGVFLVLAGLKIMVAIINMYNVITFTNGGGEWSGLDPILHSPLWWNASVYILCILLLVILGVYLTIKLHGNKRPYHLSKESITKCILTPFTMFLWYLTTYYGLYIVFIGVGFMFYLNWLWLIIGYTFLIGIVFAISNSIPTLLRILILKIYGIDWFSCIVHSIAGVIGLVQIILIFSANPPDLVIGGKPTFILTGLWRISPLKTVVLTLPFVGFVVCLLWSTILFPIYIKLLGEEL